jgi:hypothetical protein
MEELWKPVAGFEGLYEVSNMGKVMSLKSNILLAPSISNYGYLQVVLSKHWTETYNKFVHRLVAEAFVPNPNKLPQVHHKDEKKQNNIYTNLEWCTALYNVQQSNSKIVQQRTLTGELIAEFNSTYDAARETGFYQCSISKACRKVPKFIHFKGFIWQYKEVKNADNH